MSILLFPENDARLGEIVRGKLDRHFVPRDDADEMLAHFAGNMREYVTLTREIDPEHRSRQNLGHCAFHPDLFFLRHGAEIYSRRGPAQGGSASPLRAVGSSELEVKTMPNICGFAAFLPTRFRRRVPPRHS